EMDGLSSDGQKTKAKDSRNNLLHFIKTFNIPEPNVELFHDLTHDIFEETNCNNESEDLNCNEGHLKIANANVENPILKKQITNNNFGIKIKTSANSLEEANAVENWRGLGYSKKRAKTYLDPCPEIE
ncbi:hypothetical protein CBL_21216, partial [Carabus blaptoides fortunei]